MTGTDGGLTRVVLVTGLSGAGKASILRALEDLGYEAVDNPPLPLIEAVVARQDGPAPAEGRRIAVGVDARTRGFDAEAVLAAVSRLRQNRSLLPELVFAWADDAALHRRFTETRRRHPLSPHGKVSEGIAAEQALTAPLRAAADMVVDTSGLPLPSLRALVERRFATPPNRGRAGLSVAVQSFAFPGGLPRDADMVFDVRFLRNPHYVADLKSLTGLDPAVGRFVEADLDYMPFFRRLVEMLAALLPRFVQEGKKYVTIAIGCTGGRHRSVHTAERLAEQLGTAGWRVTCTHRELPFDPASQHGSIERGRAGTSPSVQAQEA